MGKLYTAIVKKACGNGHKVPLLAVTIDLDKYHKSAKGSAMVRFHPDFKNDKHLQEMAFNMTDYIRNNYDMDKLITCEKNEKK